MAGIEAVVVPSTVLVVDDESSVLQLLTAALSAKHLSVKTAASGEEAMQALAREPFGCLLVDKNLPGMDGVEVLRRARTLQPHCACIVMTGYASVDSAVEALRLGAADYVQKPFPSLQLVAEKVRIALVNVRLVVERERLLEQLRKFESELEKRDAQLHEKRTEIEIFNNVLEARVAAAEHDLKRRCEMLSEQLALNIGADRATRLSAEMVLDTANALIARDEAAPLRGELARIVRQIQDHVALLRNRESGATPQRD
jgi:FixJ family two-component response regulator